jgi:hypothetical protein
LPLQGYKGLVGMNRWVGLGVIADNLVNIGCAMEPSPTHSGATASNPK